MTLQANNDLDLVVATLNELGEYKWTDAVATIQDYVFLSQMLRKERTGFEAGPRGQFNIQVKPGGAASMVGLMATDVINIVNTLITGLWDWRHCNTNWAVDQREIAMNRQPRRILDLVNTRRQTAMRDLAELLETQAWSLPGGAADVLNLYGIPYWIVPNTSQGFNGGNPFGYSGGAAGVSSVTYPTWANYTDQWTEPTQLDLIRKWRRAAYFTNFMSPTNVTIPSYSTGNRYGYYTTMFVLQRCEEAAAFQNDNLGTDIAKMDGQAVFRRIPITWAPKLESLSGQGMSGTFVNATYASTGGQPVNPIYGINWGIAQIAFLEGWYMREQGPYMVPGQHTLLATQVDTSLQFVIRDRRRNFVLTQ